MKVKNKKSKTLKFDILLRIIISVSLSFFVIVGYNDYASQKLVLEIAKSSIKKQEETAINAISTAVESGVRIKNEIAFLYQALDFSNELIQKKILELVKSIDQVDFITLNVKKDRPTYIRAFEFRKSSGLKNYMGKEIPNKTQFILNFCERSENYLMFFSEDFSLISKVEIDTPNEDELKNNVNWPNVYLKNKTPLISYKNIIQKSDETAEVEVETNLKELSLILNNLRLTDRARFFVLDGSNNVIIDSDNIDGGTNQILNVKDFGNLQLLEALKESKLTTKFEKISHFTSEGESYLSAVSSMPPSSNLDWKIVTLISTKDFLDKFRSIERTSFVISIIVLLLVLTYLYFQIHKLSEPITYLSMEADKINNLELADPVYVASNVREITDLTASMQQLKLSVSNFSKYIPKGLVQRFIDTGEQVGIGGKSTKLTILFSDVAGFTTISEQTAPQELIFQLSEYFESLSSVILENNGTIDKYIGDAIMAFWGAPDADEKQIVHACRAALVCQHKLRGLNKYWAAQKKPILLTRIGIHSGTAVVGNVGSTERMNYTALGDSVNLAARLEGTNKMYGTAILISEAVVKGLPEDFVTRPVDIVAVKGKDKGVRIFELIGINNDPYLAPVPSEIREFAARFGEAFDLYINQKWEEAIKAFSTLRTDNLYKDDIMAEKYIERCENFIKNPPGASWDGVIHLKEK